MKGFLKSPIYGWLGLLVILLVSATVYSPAVEVPFYLDDSSSIETRIPDFKEQPLSSVWSDNERRSFSYSTIWLDTQIHGASVKGFHITNIVIHLLVTVCVFLFSKAAIRAIKPNANAVGWALAVTALWSIHPLNSQAVIYVVQRMTSLATLFAILSMLGWLKWRVTNSASRYSWLLVAFVALFLSWHSKETAAVIPLLWLAIDILLPKQSLRGWGIVTLLGIALLVLVLPILHGVYPDILQQLDQASRQTYYFDRAEYFWAQQEILFSYMGRWFWPQDLLLYYPFYEGGSAGEHIGYLSGHIALLAVAVVTRKRLPMFALGILIFYVGHAVESTVFPIKDIAFEHRNYLPTLGLAMASLAFISFVWKRVVANEQRIWQATAFITVAVILSVVTYQRAIAWQTPTEFYQHEFEVSGENPDAKVVWATQLLEQEKYKEAELLLKDVIDYYQQRNYMNVTAADNYLRAIHAQGGYYESLLPGIKMLAKVKQPHARSQLLTTLALAYIELDGCDMAAGFLKKAQELDRSNDRAKEYAKRCDKEEDTELEQ